jgi:hypothetical protein
MPDKSFYVEHRIGEEWVEYEYEIPYEYSPPVAGRISGPPEDCYPAEGGYADDFEGPLKRRLVSPNGSPWEIVPFSIFLEGLVENRRLTDDPTDKPYRKTAIQKAMQEVESELEEAGADDLRGRYEDAMEAKFEQDRDDMRDGSYWSHDD